MSGYKLYYSSERAIGEVQIIKLIFATAGKDYEDIPLNGDQAKNFPKDFPDIPAVFARALPLLKVGENDFLYFTEVISRSLAREFGLVGDDNRQHSSVDSICALVEYLGKVTTKYHQTNDEKEKTGLKEEIEERLKLVDTILHVLTGKQGKYFLGDKISVADLSFFLWTQYIDKVMPDVMPKYPKLQTLVDHVRNHENVSKFLQ